MGHAIIKLLCKAMGAVVVVVGMSAPAMACNYGKYGLTAGDSTQATVKGLFQGSYDAQKAFLVADWRREAEDLSDATDKPGRLGYAWALHRSSQADRSAQVYEEMLRAAPEDYEVLCSYATMLHENRRYPQARTTLEKAIALKPGFRSRAEELHLDMIIYQEKSKTTPGYAPENLFVPSLTPLWKNRRGTDQNFSTVKFPDGLKSEGMAELLRQFPHFGEAWLGLGMLLEHEKDFSMAAKAYDRALERGTAHGPELKKYMLTFREFGREHDAGRVVGRGIIKLVVIVLALLVGLFLFRIVARVVSDITSHRAMKEKERNRERKAQKGPDSPL